jgi:molybdopterin synthase catalytic subunit
MIKVQAMPFNVTDELQQIKQGRRNIGATAIFVGSVRDMSDGAHVAAMTLEHYPGMTERALGDIETEARKRFDVSDTLIIHRYGKLAAGEDIVLVITCSAHREAAFQACEFLMDWLKTKAPFWKLEEGLDGANWVAEKASDEEATARWRT